MATRTGARDSQSSRWVSEPGSASRSARAIRLPVLDDHCGSAIAGNSMKSTPWRTHRVSASRLALQDGNPGTR